MKIQAQCECGSLHFISTEGPVLQICCHCEDCRNTTKNNYSKLAFFNIKTSKTIGKTTINNYISGNNNATKRHLCSSCGTVMFDTSEGFPTLIGIFTQQIAAPFMFNPACHLWVKSKLPKVVIPKDAVQYEKGLP